MPTSGVRGGRREPEPSIDDLGSEPSRGSRERELDAEEMLEDELVLRDLGRLGPAWWDSGMEGSSFGEPGRESPNGGRIGVVIDIFRE